MAHPNVITLAEFSDWHDEIKGVEVDSFLPLPPYVPADEIDIHLNNLITMARVRHFSVVRVGHISNTPEVNYHFISSHSERELTPDGGSRAPIIHSLNALHLLQSVVTTSHKSGECHISINTAHSDLSHAIVRRPEPWATVLDKGLKEGLRQANAIGPFNPIGYVILQAMIRTTTLVQTTPV